MTTNGRGVLLVGNFLSSARGTQGICEVLAKKLSLIGWSVTTTSNKTSRSLRLYDMLTTTWRERSKYNVAQIDVFSGPSFLWAEAVCWILRRLKKPYVLTLHGGNLPGFAQRWQRRVNRLLRSAARVTTPSIYIKTSFSKICDDILLLPNGVDLSSYSFQHRLQPAPRLTWLRAFHAIYNPIMAAKALSFLVSEFPDIHLTMFGPDKKDGSLNAMKKWAQEASIAPRIHTPGPIPKTKIPSELASYDIFLNTTSAESFGVSVMEAAALGMCIVTTDVGELPYIWTDGHDALLVPPDDPQAMADAIRRILTEPELAARLSRNARAKAEQFDWSIVLPQWERLLLNAQTGT